MRRARCGTSAARIAGPLIRLLHNTLNPLHSRSTIMLMTSSTVKHALGSLPFVQEFVESRKRHLQESYGVTFSEMLADPELMRLVGGLDCGYSEHIFGIVSNVASFAEIRKGLVSFPLINNILVKILREGSNLAKCNAALAIKGM